MLRKELQQRLISSLILALNPLILQIRTRSHPAMNLISENLNMLLTLQVLLELLDILLEFIITGQHAKRDLDAFGFGGIDHCWVAFGGCFEWGR